MWLASRHPQTPWYAQLWLAVVVAYALSPIDLIPDFIPVVGYLDDLILLPLGLWIAVRLVPPAVLQECRAAARQHAEEQPPGSRKAAVVIVLVWILLLAWLGGWAVNHFMRAA